MTDDAHARPSGDAPEPLYDVSVATPSHAERARTLAAGIPTGTLCTMAQDPEGYPYGSFVTVAFHGGNPVFLISELAEHTKNLRKDERASLVVAETKAADPLANGRVTVIGPCKPVEAGALQAVRETFLAMHPGASYYVDFKDFSFWQLTVQSVRYIGGYGRMSWVATEAWHKAEPDPLGDAAEGIVRHMNEDHVAAMVDMCKALSKATDTGEASMTSVDRYGFEMSAVTAEGPRPVRLAFENEVTSPEQARKEVVALVHKAREKLADSR